mmetsp:Transcript_70514/g.206338  ORF Transcript_70514/g.206338 Transcript_70514/m.206338 type:complete len:320 (-) Transcript_70514:1941-2900(-)
MTPPQSPSTQFRPCATSIRQSATRAVAVGGEEAGRVGAEGLQGKLRMAIVGQETVGLRLHVGPLGVDRRAQATAAEQRQQSPQKHLQGRLVGLGVLVHLAPVAPRGAGGGHPLVPRDRVAQPSVLAQGAHAGSELEGPVLEGLLQRPEGAGGALVVVDVGKVPQRRRGRQLVPAARGVDQAPGIRGAEPLHARGSPGLPPALVEEHPDRDAGEGRQPCDHGLKLPVEGLLALRGPPDLIEAACAKSTGGGSPGLMQQLLLCLTPAPLPDGHGTAVTCGHVLPYQQPQHVAECIEHRAHDYCVHTDSVEASFFDGPQVLL